MKIHLCFVCLGNICRSPTAEAIMLNLVEESGLEDHLAVEPAWPESREADFSLIPGGASLVSLRMAEDEFRQIASQVYAWSDSLQCRHFVMLIDETTTKNSYKRLLALVERFFYKYPVPD